MRLASCRADFRDRFLPALRIAAYDDDMDAKPGQFIRGRPANPARSSCKSATLPFTSPFSIVSLSFVHHALR